MSAAKRIGTRWTWVPLLAGYDPSEGVQECVIVSALVRPEYVSGQTFTYIVLLDNGQSRYAHDRCLWPLGSIVRPTCATQAAA